MEGNVIESVAKIIEPIVLEEGFKLYDIAWTLDRGRKILRVMVEGEGREVTIDDCARLSHSIEDVIEVKGLIPERYDLEVSSPGLRRPLKKEEHFRRVLGKVIRVKTKTPIGGRKNYKGELKKIEGGQFVVEVDQSEFVIPFDLVDKANLEYIG